MKKSIIRVPLGDIQQNFVEEFADRLSDFTRPPMLRVTETEAGDITALHLHVVSEAEKSDNKIFELGVVTGTFLEDYNRREEERVKEQIKDFFGGGPSAETFSSPFDFGGNGLFFDLLAMFKDIQEKRQEERGVPDPNPEPEVSEETEVQQPEPEAEDTSSMPEVVEEKEIVLEDPEMETELEDPEVATEVQPEPEITLEEESQETVVGEEEILSEEEFEIKTALEVEEEMAISEIIGKEEEMPLFPGNSESIDTPLEPVETEEETQTEVEETKTEVETEVEELEEMTVPVKTETFVPLEEKEPVYSSRNPKVKNQSECTTDACREARIKELAEAKASAVKVKDDPKSKSLLGRLLDKLKSNKS